ncbi:MAG: ABC transporter ATP-binding protein [Promethearchaeota archaeon]
MSSRSQPTTGRDPASDGVVVQNPKSSGSAGRDTGSGDTSNYSIVMDGVSVAYGKTEVLHGISFRVERGSILGLVGSSGAGKSTAIRVMTAQMAPSRGEAHTAGYDVSRHPRAVRNRIGYVPQLEYLSLYYQFGILDNAKIFGRQYGIPDSVIEQRCRDIMQILGLPPDEFLHKPVARLSGGEKKGCSIVVGLVNNPEVLFLDEPTTGLDPHLRIEVLNFLLRINKEYGTTMVLVSHDLECVDYCNYVGCMQDGCLVDFGKPRQMVESLPRAGRQAIVQFKYVSPDIEQKLNQVDGVKYCIHGGRNTLKLFIEPGTAFSDLVDPLAGLGLKIRRVAFDQANFLDYFRVMSHYSYEGRVVEFMREYGGMIGKTGKSASYTTGEVIGTTPETGEGERGN